MHIEQRLEKLERQNRNQRMALMLLTVVLCGVVTMAATGSRDGDFYTISARWIIVDGKTGEPLVVLGANDDGHGLVTTHSASGKDLVKIGAASADGGGGLLIFNKR